LNHLYLPFSYPPYCHFMYLLLLIISFALALYFLINIYLFHNFCKKHKSNIHESNQLHQYVCIGWTIWISISIKLTSILLIWKYSQDETAFIKQIYYRLNSTFNYQNTTSNFGQEKKNTSFDYNHTPQIFSWWVYKVQLPQSFWLGYMKQKITSNNSI